MAPIYCESEHECFLNNEDADSFVSYLGSGSFRRAYADKNFRYVHKIGNRASNRQEFDAIQFLNRSEIRRLLPEWLDIPTTAIDLHGDMIHIIVPYMEGIPINKIYTESWQPWKYSGPTLTEIGVRNHYLSVKLDMSDTGTNPRNIVMHPQTYRYSIVDLGNIQVDSVLNALLKLHPKVQELEELKG